MTMPIRILALRSMAWSSLMILIIGLGTVSTRVSAQEETTAEGEAAASDEETLEMETVLDGLYNPCGIAIQPETGHVFVADSGHGKIIRIVDGAAQDVITDFALDVYGKGPMYDIGPLGIAFLGKDKLVVGGGSHPDGEEFLSVYNVPEVGAEAVKADAAVTQLSLAPTEEIKGEGNFYALAITETAVYVTCNGDDTKGWVSKATITDGTVGPFERFIATKEAVEVDAPVGITISPRGEIVVGQMGEITVPEDGLLTFYNEEAEMLANFEAGLSDITAIAYSPKGESEDRQLYALDFTWFDTTQGGLFQLIGEEEEGEMVVRANKLASLDKPTAMAFAPDGSLYILVIGTDAEGGSKDSGKLLKVAPGL